MGSLNTTSIIAADDAVAKTVETIDNLNYQIALHAPYNDLYYIGNMLQQRDMLQHFVDSYHKHGKLSTNDVANLAKARRNIRLLYCA